MCELRWQDMLISAGACVDRWAVSVALHALRTFSSAVGFGLLLKFAFGFVVAGSWAQMRGYIVELRIDFASRPASSCWGVGLPISLRVALVILFQVASRVSSSTSSRPWQKYVCDAW